MSSAVSPATHIIADLLFCGAWFTVFGLLQDWYEDAMQCGSKWDWDMISLRNGQCGKWSAIQAFVFMEAIFWFASFTLGTVVWKKYSTPTTASDGGGGDDGAATAAAPTTTGLVAVTQTWTANPTMCRRKRWFGRSRV